MVVSVRWKEKLRLILFPVVPFIFMAGWLLYIFGDKPGRLNRELEKDTVQNGHGLPQQEILQK